MESNIFQFQLVIYFFISITISYAVSQQPETECVIDFERLSAPNSSCEGGGDWGGFLPGNCCVSAFHGYLYAIGWRANQTGDIYLNSSEQGSCLTSMKRYDGDIFGCGIERLTSGAGGCSDFSVDDVAKRYGDHLKGLQETCRLLESSGEGWNQTCSACVKSWEKIKGVHFSSSSPASMEAENNVCRFAVLISLTSSQIKDDSYARNLYQCLEDAAEVFVADNSIPDGRRKTKHSTGVWIATGIGILVAVTIVAAACILTKRYLTQKQLSNNPAFRDERLEKTNCPKFSIKEVYLATDNLNEQNFIGEGTSGKVYKGTLSNNRCVAIKHIVNDGHLETFVREVVSLSHVRHPNLVALLGYCVREDECFLICELCPNGSLSEWLFGKDKVLSWIQRLEIAVGSARGLHFLHTYSEGSIVHRDIKPTNILLGSNFEAKLSDFGLSKVIDLGETNASSEVRGTFGYVDPEYETDRKVNSSGDVYSFGIVLLQILSGKKVINMNLKKPMPLDKMAKAFTKSRSTAEFADPKLEGKYSVEAFDLTLQLALSCTSGKQERPPIEQVLNTLQMVLDFSTSAEVSALLEERC